MPLEIIEIPLIPSKYTYLLDQVCQVRSNIISSMMIPKELMYNNEWTTFDLNGYYENFRSQLNKKTAITWLEVNDEP